jgi:hypothetical protein
MLEIIIMIAVVRAFYRTAQSKKLNGYVWGAIGAFSFYIPVLIMGLGILPALVENGTLQIHSYGQALFIGVLLNALAGTIGCLTAWNILKRQRVAEVINDEILDNELERVK